MVTDMEPLNSRGHMDENIYDECGDPRLMTEEERQRMLKIFEQAKPIISKQFGNMVIFGTSHPHGGSIEEDFQKLWESGDKK